MKDKGRFGESGVEYYQIKAVIDDRTSAICERLHGTVFPIQRATDYKNGLLSNKPGTNKIILSLV